MQISQWVESQHAPNPCVVQESNVHFFFNCTLKKKKCMREEDTLSPFPRVCIPMKITTFMKCKVSCQILVFGISTQVW